MVGRKTRRAYDAANRRGDPAPVLSRWAWRSSGRRVSWNRPVQSHGPKNRLLLEPHLSHGSKPARNHRSKKANDGRAELFALPVSPDIPTALVKTACGSGGIDYVNSSLTAGELEITRSFNTFSTFQSSMRKANLTCLASGAICVPLCGFTMAFLPAREP